MRDLIPPTAIPDLSSLQPQGEWFGVQRGLAGGGSQNCSAYVLQANAIRLADAALHEYRIGEACLAQFHNRNPGHFGIAPLLAATTHFEACVWHLERFIKHVKALRACKSAEPELLDLVPRNMPLLKGAVEGKLTKLRHTLAHLEQCAVEGAMPEGASMALMPLKRGLEVSSHVVPWDTLAEWLVEANECAQRLARFRPPTADG